MPEDQDNVTNGELYRSLSDLKAEMRELKTGFVPRGEYEENRKAQGERIGSAERGVAKIDAILSGINRTAWAAVILGIVVPILTAVLLVNLGLG